MKDKLKNAEKMFRSKLAPGDRLMAVSKEQFELKQDDARLFNDIWQLKNKRLAITHKLKDLEDEKDEIFVKMGLKKVVVSK